MSVADDRIDLQPVEPGEIRFFHHFLPALAGGDYELEVRLDLDRDEVPDDQHFERRQRFRVEAPRLGLAASDVHAVYPPADSEGAYAETLPHIVLRRRRLPWEIEHFIEHDGTSRRVPWVALLVFHPGEEPEIVTGLAKDLLVSADGHSLITLGPAEREKRIATIDVPGDVYASAGPRDADRPYLAHARQVSVVDKEPLGISGDGWFSVVIANRLPKPGRNVAHLVSLEGVDTTATLITLVSLAHWSFTVEPDRGSFSEKIQAVASLRERKSLRLRVEPPSLRADDTTTEARALRAGFVPLRYDMRHGEQTVAWYRGPLVPEPVAPVERGPLSAAEAGLVFQPSIGMFDVSLAVAWQLGRLLGLSDAGFSGALMRWRRQAQAQIDKTLAQDEVLERQARIATLTTLRTLSSRATDLRHDEEGALTDAEQRRLEAEGERRQLTPEEQLRLEAKQALDANRASLVHDLERYILRLRDPKSIATEVGQFTIDQVLGRMAGHMPAPRDDKLRLLTAPPADPRAPSTARPPATGAPVDPLRGRSADATTNGTDDDHGSTAMDAVDAVATAERNAGDLSLTDVSTTEVPAAVESWLARLALLYGVPFEHLVPDASMLPPESIRFFHVDANWIEAMIDGAFSVGVHSARDIRFHWQLQSAVRTATDVAAGKLRAGLVGTTTVSEATQAADRAGFVMRSEIVSGWPGLEVRGFVDDHGDLIPVELLRLDRPAPDLMIAIFARVPDIVEMAEPPEDLHFGISRADADRSHLLDDGSERVDLPALAEEKGVDRSADLAIALVDGAVRHRFERGPDSGEEAGQ